MNPTYADAIAAAQLTDRQTTVLEYWLADYSIRRIGLALGISEATVRGHRDAALRKIRPHIANTRRRKETAA